MNTVNHFAIIPAAPPLPIGVLIGPTPEQVATFAAAHPARFVFTFLTCPAKAVGDWSGLPKSDHIAQPMWIGAINQDELDDLMDWFVEQGLPVRLT